MNVIYTVGHSNHDIDTFISLLKLHQITTIADVRSHPYSRYLPHFSKNDLEKILNQNGFKYVFLGAEFGARSNNPNCYVEGRVQYERLALEPLFLEGVDRVKKGLQENRIALLCAEKDPIECHRALLVSRVLFNNGIQVEHILADGTLELQHELEIRLLNLCKLPHGDMFKSREDFVSDAYRIQGQKVAYQDEKMISEGGEAS